MYLRYRLIQIDLTFCAGELRLLDPPQQHQ